MSFYVQEQQEHELYYERAKTLQAEQIYGMSKSSSQTLLDYPPHYDGHTNLLNNCRLLPGG